MRYKKRIDGLLTEKEALHHLGWKYMMSNRIKLAKYMSEDSVLGHAKTRWYWLHDLPVSSDEHLSNSVQSGTSNP